MAIALPILDRFAKFSRSCKER